MSHLTKAADLFLAGVAAEAPALGRDRVVAGLRDLFGGGRDLQLGALTRQLLSSSLTDQARSWLGDGPNAELKPAQLGALFSEEAIGTLARSLGISDAQARQGIAHMLPRLIDSNSSAGELRAALDIARRLRSVVQRFR